MLKVLTLEEKVEELKRSSKKNMDDLGKGAFAFVILTIAGMALVGGAKPWIRDCDTVCAGLLMVPDNQDSITIPPEILEELQRRPSWTPNPESRTR